MVAKSERKSYKCVISIAGVVHGVYILESSASNGHGSEGVDFKLNQQGAV